MNFFPFLLNFARNKLTLCKMCTRKKWRKFFETIFQESKIKSTKVENVFKWHMWTNQEHTKKWRSKIFWSEDFLLVSPQLSKDNGFFLDFLRPLFPQSRDGQLTRLPLKSDLTSFTIPTGSPLKNVRKMKNKMMKFSLKNENDGHTI